MLLEKQKVEGRNVCAGKSPYPSSTASMKGCAQVLRCLDDTAASEVFWLNLADSEGAQEAVEAALRLPQDLLARWVAAQAPALRMWNITLLTAHWARLAACLPQAHPTEFITLHMSLASRKCGTEKDEKSKAVDPCEVLFVLGGVASQMCYLKELCLGNLLLTMSCIRGLGQLFSTLPSSVVILYLTFAQGHVQSSSTGTALESMMFFRAIALVRSLEQLFLPQWEWIVGEDAYACTEPLRGLPHLQTIHVREVRATAAFPSCFNYINYS